MKLVLILAFLFINQKSFSSEGPGKKEFRFCKKQIQEFCPEKNIKKDFREVISCLKEVHPKLSTDCKQELQRFFQASRQTRPQGGGGPLASIGGMAGPGAQVPTLSYNGRFLSDSSKQSRILENNLNFSVPVYKEGRNALALTGRGGVLQFGEAITLDSGIQVKKNLTRTELGLQYSRILEGKRTFGFSSSFGYEGDEMSPETQNISLRANYSFPTESGNRWVLLLMMSNNSPLGAFIPIPGFFYITRSSTFTGIFGFPIISLQWTPVNPWSFSFTAFGPQIKTEVSYGDASKIQYFSGLGLKQQRYMLKNREFEDDRLSIEEKYAEVGLRKPIFKGAFLESQLGYSFDRSVYVGEGLFNSDRGEANLNSNFYLNWSLRVAF